MEKTACVSVNWPTLLVGNFHVDLIYTGLRTGMVRSSMLFSLRIFRSHIA